MSRHSHAVAPSVTRSAAVNHGNRQSFGLSDPSFVYTPAVSTDLRAKWAAFFAEHAKPETAESYQQDQINEHAAREIPGNY